MTSKNVFLCGDTVRIKAKFTDFDGVNIDPDIVKLIIYNKNYTKLSEYVLTSANKIDTGIWYYDYTIPMEHIDRYFFYEFYGEIGGKPFINREGFKVEFVQ